MALACLMPRPTTARDRTLESSLHCPPFKRCRGRLIPCDDLTSGRWGAPLLCSLTNGLALCALMHAAAMPLRAPLVRRWLQKAQPPCSLPFAVSSRLVPLSLSPRLGAAIALCVAPSAAAIQRPSLLLHRPLHQWWNYVVYGVQKHA